jgi:phosphoglycerate dehydrogenase-like enzyme/predicted dehydrogenase
MTTIALVGCGQIATAAHLPAMKALEAKGILDLVAVCDIDRDRAERARKRFGVARSFARWTEMVDAARPDAIAVCLPPGPNADVSCDALAAGLHVLCEKPPGRDVSDAARMAAAAARADRVHMIAFNRRYAPLYTKAITRSARLGLPHVFYGRFTRAALGSAPSNTATDWITSDGSHALDLAVATIGFPERVSVARTRIGAGPPNSWTIQLHAPNGSAVLLLDFAAGRRVERFEWAGPGYDVLLELPERGEFSQHGSPEEHWKASADAGSTEVYATYGFLDEYRAFVDAIGGKRPRPAADFAYGVDFMRLVAAILACPSGETRDIASAPAVPALPALPAFPAAPAISVRRALQRPVARLMQPARARERFFTQDDLSRLSRVCDLRFQEDAGDSFDDVEAIVTGWSSPIPTADQLDAAAALRLVVVLGASVKAVAPERLLSRGVAICNTADAIAASVAEHCLLLALAGLRRLTTVDGAMHRGEWPPNPGRFDPRTVLRRASRSAPAALRRALRPLKTTLRTRMGGTPATQNWRDLAGQTVGLIGWGHVARRFARLLEPFGCHVLVASNSIRADDVERFAVYRASVVEVLGASQVISLHKGLTEETKGLLGKAELDLIRPGSVLINTARSQLIDESALLSRARRGDIVVGLDVFEREPLPPRHPLRRLSNVILTPHNASTTPECQRRVGRQAIDIVSAWIAGERVPALTAPHLSKMT